MDIIEKLGITPGPWEDVPKSKTKICTDIYHILEGDKGFYDNDKRCGFTLSGFISISDITLISVAPEILHDLIDAALVFEAETGIKHFSVPTIEKATGRTWDEIKELLND